MSTITTLSTAAQVTSAAPSVTTSASDATHHNSSVGTNRDKKASDELSPQALDAALSTINQAFNPYGVEFEIDDESGRVITRVVDSKSGEQIRQIPSEELMRILHYVESQRKEPQSGLLIDDVA